MERTLNKGGTRLTYIPVSEVITRLNRVFGVGGWSSQIVSCKRDDLDPDYIVASVTLSARIAGEDDKFTGGWISHDGIGGQKIKRTKSGDIVDLGDEMKGAVSDALKKAAQQFGIGLYLARDIDAVEMEAAEAEAEGVADLYANFKSLRDGMNEDEVEQIRTFWSEWSGGRPGPKPAEFTQRELEALIAECVRIKFDGTLSVKTGEDDDES